MLATPTPRKDAAFEKETAMSVALLVSQAFRSASNSLAPLKVLYNVFTLATSNLFTPTPLKAGAS